MTVRSLDMTTDAQRGSASIASVPLPAAVPVVATSIARAGAGTRNSLAAAAAAAGDVDRLSGVLKVTGFVACVPAFTGQPGVINGASELLAEIFGEAGQHARSAVGVAVLPLDAPVEVEFLFEFH